MYLALFASLTPEQSDAVNMIIQWATDFLGYMLPILPYLMGLVFIFALLYKFTLGAVKKL